MMIMYYVREKLIETLKTAYPETYQTYEKFFVDMSFKESKTNERYDHKTKKIIVSTLSRSSGEIYLSYLLGLARHIDIIDRRETHNDEKYLAIVRKLIHAALCRNMLEKQALYHLNEKLQKELQEHYGSFSNWQSKNQIVPDTIYIRVYDAIMIRNILKLNHYMFDQDQICWQKKLQPNDHEEELFIHEYQEQADFHILNTNQFIVTPVYKLCINTYAKEYNEFLKSIDYQYDSNKNLWWKVVFAAAYNDEMKFISDVPCQRKFITRNKR